MMDEQFLHYIWKYQLFENPSLIDNQDLNVFYPGDHNMDSGPDFAEARLKIGSIEWAGQVEIHTKSSDWLQHKHNQDEAYDSVILHVVWKHDKEINVNGAHIPTLELRDKVHLDLINKYQNHLQSQDEILCQSQLARVNAMNISGMIDRVMVERLRKKAELILTQLRENKNDWEEVTYASLTTNFGFSTNKNAFLLLSKRLPFFKFKKVLQDLKATEALIFGQAGFLASPSDDYQINLKEEYLFQSKKHQIKDPMIRSQWKFGKLRPPNFPTVRLAQLASLYHQYPKLFNGLIETENVKDLKSFFKVRTSEYWQTHYDFGKVRKHKTSGIGVQSIEILLINSVAPILAAYAKFTGEQHYMDRAVSLLESLRFEENRTTRKFDPNFFPSKNAFDSQALIELYKSYCIKKRCLNCHIGVSIISN